MPEEECARSRKPMNFAVFCTCVKEKTEQITHVDRVFRKTFSVNPGLVFVTTNMLLLVNVM